MNAGFRREYGLGKFLSLSLSPCISQAQDSCVMSHFFLQADALFLGTAESIVRDLGGPNTAVNEGR